jgi:hypothetical protein
MTTSLFQKDLINKNDAELSIVLNSLILMCNPELSLAILPQVVAHISHNKGFIRKKAIILLSNIM